MRKFLGLLLLASTTFGQMSSNQSQYIRDYSLLTNPGLEQGLAGWSVTGGTLARETTNKRSGSAALSWDASASTQELSTTLVTVPLGDGACLAEFYYKGFGTADIHYWVENNSGSVIGGYSSTGDGLNYVISSAASAYTKSAAITFSCPTSGTVQLVLQAQGDAAIGYVDDAYLGRDFRVGSGIIVTEWESFTPTGSWSANTTYTGRKRRVGDTLEMDITLTLAGAPTSAALTIDVPDSLTIDTTKLPSTGAATKALHGNGTIFDSSAAAGANIFHAAPIYSSTTAFYFQVFNSNDYATITQASPVTFASGDIITANVKIPIVEWAATGTTVRGDETIVDIQVHGTPTAGAFDLSTAIEWAAEDRNIGGAWNQSTGEITIPRSATYCWNAQITVSGTEANNDIIIILPYVNGSSTSRFQGFSRVMNTGLSSTNAKTDGCKYFDKGDVVTFRASSDIVGVAYATNAANWMNFYQLTGAVPKPFSPGSVFAGRSGVSNVGVAELNCDAASAITTDLDSMISAIGNIATGACSVTLTTGYFSSTPTCVVSLNEAAARLKNVTAVASSATAVVIDSREGSTSGSATTVQDATSFDGNLICWGNN